MQSYSPGQVADKTGFSLDTLRYYERIGLIGGLARTSGGRRVFTDDDVGWLEILRCLRDTGMPISRMQRYAELTKAGDETMPERIALLEEHDRAVDEQVRNLRAQQRRVRDKIRWYRGLSAESG
jgi:DNA-binding transcriptional MerR regulator